MQMSLEVHIPHRKLVYIGNSYCSYSSEANFNFGLEAQTHWLLFGFTVKILFIIFVFVILFSQHLCKYSDYFNY